MTSMPAVELTHAPIRLDDAVTWFLGSWPNEGPRLPTADTIRDYTYSLKWLVEFAARHGQTDVLQLDADLLRAAVKETRERPGKRAANFKGGEATARTLVAATRKLAGWLVAQGLPVADLSTVKAPRIPERVQRRLTPQEFAKLEEAALRHLVEAERTNPRVTCSRNVALLYLLADTGLRAGEVCNMSIHDVDFEQGRIIVRRGKGQKDRVMSIVDPEDPRGGDTLRLLQDWICHRAELKPDHDFLFVSLKRKPLDVNSLGRILARLCQEAGIDGNRPPHAFRRATFTERYRQHPEQIDVLSARMGWSPRSHHMRNVYTRGAQLDFASEVELPSMAASWHARRDKLNGTHRSRRKKDASALANATVQGLLALVTADPSLRSALRQVLNAQP